MKILITGVAGLLGSRLAGWILANTPHTVIGVDDLSGGYTENIPINIDKFRKFDLKHLEPVKELFEQERPDIVYHFAAYAAEGLSPFIRGFNYENNLIASTNLITASIEYGVKRFVFASSMSVYGNQHQPPFEEDMQPSPIDPYGIAKYAVEQDLEVAFQQHGLEYTIIRPHNVYGRNQNIWDKYRNVLGIWMYQILQGDQPTIFGDGLQTRAFSYIDDCLAPLWRASQEDSCKRQIINLGGIHNVSIVEACQTLLDVAKVPIKAKFLEERHEVRDAWSSWHKSVELLGFHHKTTLHEGLRQMWEWAQNQPQRQRFVWPNYELNKGIYSYWKN